jgi:hypothetical protein
LLLNITPGPDLLSAPGRATIQGARAGIAAAHLGWLGLRLALQRA